MTERSRRVVLSLGANLGDRLATLQGAVEALAGDPDLHLVAVSRVYETDPVGGPEQDDFLNIVALAESSLEPREVLQRAHAVEDQFGRVREIRWGPRTLDVDVIAVGDVIVDGPDLQVPHPRAAERAFVLVPWLDVEPDAELPGVGKVAVAVDALDTTGVRRRADLAIVMPDET